MFICEKCGQCCCNINKNSLYKELDNGEGVCIHYNKVTRLCNIYEQRPILCRIDDAYELYFKTSLSKEKYYELNYESCRKLRKLNGG